MVKFLLLFCVIRLTFSQICSSFCLKCNNPQLLCDQCQEGFVVNNQNGKCQSNCKYGQYYYQEINQCVSICPDKYYNDDESFTCRQLQNCPFLSEQGLQFFDEFRLSVTLQDFVVAAGVSYLYEDFTLKIFNATNGKYLGYLDGHDSEIIMLNVIESTQQLLSISENQMIWWNLYYGQKDYVIEFGKLDDNQQMFQNQIQSSKRSTYMYKLDKGIQIYYDEQIIILMLNPKQFGILYHQNMRNHLTSTINIQQFQQYFQLFDTVHVSAIKGFFKIQDGIIGSYSSQQILTWDIKQNKTISGSKGVCNFDKQIIQRVIKVNENQNIIQFTNLPSLQIYDVEFNFCISAEFDPPPHDDKDNKFIIEDILVFDQIQKLIIVRTKKSIFFYKLQKYIDTASDNKLYYTLIQIGEQNSNNVFVQIIPNFNYILVLQSSGLLKYFLITQTEDSIGLDLIGDIDFQFNQQMYITDIHFQKESLTTILIGKGIICAKFNSAKNDEFFDYEIISSLKNISPQLNGHRSQINGIVIDRVFKNRIITYSSDGSFKVWQMLEDISHMDGFTPINSQGGYLEKASLLFDQYHPQCNIIESSKCSWGVINLEQIEQNLILTQYSDNFIIIWEYYEDTISLKFRYSLADESIKLNNYQYNKDLKYLLICSEQQLVIFDTQNDGEVIFNEANFYHRGYFFKGDKSYDNNYTLVYLLNLGAKFKFMAYYYDINTQQFTLQKQNSFKNQYIYSEIFSDSVIICVTANNLYYQLKKNPDHINVSMKFPIVYFTRDPESSKTFLLFKNGMVGIGDATKFQYFNITSSSVTLRCTAIAKNPLILFYFQNNVYYPGYNHVLGINDKFEVVFYLVFDYTISSINVDSNNSKLYIGFQNGKIYHGSYVKQQINTRDNIANLNMPLYSTSLRQLFYRGTTSILKKDLFTNQLVEFNQSGKQAVHKQKLEGYLVDEINNFLITFSKETSTCLYRWSLQNPQQNQKISDSDTKGISRAFLDLKGDILIGYSENWQDPNNYWFNIIVWQYSTLKKLYINQSHKLFFEDQKKDELPENISQMVYTVRQIIYMPNNQTIVSLNNYFNVFIYYYTKDQSDQIAIKNIFKLFYDDQSNYLYARIVDNLSQSIQIYDLQFKLKSTKVEHTFEIRDIIFSGNKAIIYDVQTILVLDRQNLQQIQKFSTVNPKVTSLIVSSKLNLAIVWNNFMTDDVLFYKIGIFELTTGKSIYELQPQSSTDYGNNNLVYLEESTCQLYYTRTTGNIYSFNVCELYNSGVYSANMQNITDMLYIPEFNYLLTINSNQACLTRVESSISSKQRFSSLYSQKNNNYFMNKASDKIYYIDFDSSVWQLNNKNYNFGYISQLDKIQYSKYYNNYFYVVSKTHLYSYDLDFKLIRSIEIHLKNIYFSGDYIFFQNQNFVLGKLNIKDFSLDSAFQIPLSYYIFDFFVLESFSEFIFYDGSQKIFRYNYVTNQKIYEEPVLQPFQKGYFFRQLNMIIHIQKNSDIIFYYNLTANMKSQDSANIYQFKNSDFQSVATQKLFFDKDNLNLIISYADNTIRVFKLSLVDNQIQSLTQIKAIPQPSVTNILKIKIRNQNLQLFLPWQVIEYDRQTFIQKNNFNSSQVFQSLQDYSISKDYPNYGFIWQQDSIRMINVQQQMIIFKFDLSYPQLTSYQIQEQIYQFDIELKGISNGVFFKYNFLIPKQTSIINQNTSYKECYFSVGPITQFYNQENQLNTLIYSLNKLSFQIERTLLQISPQLSIYYQKEIDVYNSKVLFDGKKEQGDLKQLNIKSDTFYEEPLKEVQIQNYILNITDSGFMTFNKATKKATFKDLKFTGNCKNSTLNFQNMDYVILENIIFDSIDLDNNSTLLKLTNLQFALLKNVTFTNITLYQTAKLILLKNIFRFFIANLTINGMNLYNHESTSIIQISNIKNGLIKDSFLSDLKLVEPNNTKGNYFLIDLQGNSILNIKKLIYQNSSYISLINSQNSYEEDQKIYFRVRDQVSLSELDVFNIKNLRQSLIYATGYQMILQKCNFQNIDCLECEGGIGNFHQINILSISNTTFDSAKAKNGGAIAILESRFNQSSIQDCNFYNNSAQSSGGAIYLKMSDLEFIRNKVENNTALIGGGIRYIGIQPKFVVKILQDKENKKLNQFISNRASLHSQDYGSYLYSATVQSNLVMIEIPKKRNLGEETLELGQINQLDLVIKEYEIHDFQSGGTIDLSFQIVDLENKPIKFDLDNVYEKKYPAEVIDEIQQVQVKATIENNEIKIYGQYITNYQQYDMTNLQFSIKEMQIISMPQTSNSIFLEVPAIKRASTSNQIFQNGPFYIKLVIYFRKCVQGEIYTPSSNLFLCGECKVGTYSLEEPIKEKSDLQICNRCPIEADHCFRNEIKLKNGYWRISNQTDSIIKCSNNPLNCVGDEEKGYCKIGHYGPLCEECDVEGIVWGKKYVTDGRYNCVDCTELQTDFKYFLPSMIVGLLMVVYMVISIRIAIDISTHIIVGYYLRKMNIISISKSAFMDTTNMNMKAMMNYMQIALLVNTFEVELPEFLKILPEYVGQPISNFLYTLDCFLNDIANEDFPVVYIRTIWSLAMPFLYILGMGIIYFFLILCRFTKHSKQHIISGLVFLIFFFQPSMISNLLRVMSCRKIDGKRYLLADITQNCYSQTHILYIFYICIPGIIMWGILIPLIILRKLYQNKNNLDNALVRIPYGFLYQDYKYDKYYWEFLKSYMKILIVVIHNFYGDPYNNQLVLTIIIMLIYQVALLVMKPYQMRYFQNIEKRSMEVLIVIVTMNIFLYNRPSIVQQQIFYVIVLAIHNIYQLFLIWEVVKAKSKIIYSQNKEKIQQLLKKYFPWFVRVIQMKENNSMKVFRNWKRIRNEIIFAKKKKQKLIQQKNAKIYFDDELEQEREKVKKIPITSSQLSMRADLSSHKNLQYDSSSCDNLDMISQRSFIMRDHISIISPQNYQKDQQNSFLIKSPSSQNESLISPKYQLSRNNSLFIDSGAKNSFRSQYDDNTTKDRQFDRLFEALMLQKKFQSQNETVQGDDEEEEDFNQFRDESIYQNQRQYLIYKNLSKVPTILIQTQASENQLKSLKIESLNQINEQESLALKDSSLLLPQKNINSVQPKYSNFQEKQNSLFNQERMKSSQEKMNINQQQNSTLRLKNDNSEFCESVCESESYSPLKLTNFLQFNQLSFLMDKNQKYFDKEDQNSQVFSFSDKKSQQNLDNINKSQVEQIINITEKQNVDFNFSFDKNNCKTPQKHLRYHLDQDNQLDNKKQIIQLKNQNQHTSSDSQYDLDQSYSMEQPQKNINNIQLKQFTFDKFQTQEHNQPLYEEKNQESIMKQQNICKLELTEQDNHEEYDKKKAQTEEDQNVEDQAIKNLNYIRQNTVVKNSTNKNDNQNTETDKNEEQKSKKQTQLDMLFGDSEAQPKSFLNKLKKQVTSEYYNEAVFANHDWINSSNSINTFKNDNRFDVYTLKNNLASNVVAKNIQTDPDSAIQQQDYSSSRIQEISSDSDGNRVILTFCPQDQKDVAENSIQSQSLNNQKTNENI
ncbi:transmembrane protein, putative (macronuclear) [Tetrahymena thermophila SB210]|uniref:Transmembrane protein, putative n=1 Tax=Tetrahymena thermophila (strain SB210) TaxID=312017 RepID=W7X2R8_TETTS|nr:transmembrane protein, putative [Tetrahymena thermophila SB210]EWS73585.1 transmembrane protein, putative [Tetrahymena thermophila SB210]|eukprot:XP_012653881.1 transmembrane protein, putative [Tetrahymena thermophila SB210]